MSKAELRKLPSVDKLLQHKSVLALQDAYSLPLITDAARTELDSARQAILSGQSDAPSKKDLAVAMETRLRKMVSPTLQPVINASGVIVHTNLGRALLSHRAQQAMVEAAASYSNLEYDLDAGQRGSRYHHAESLLCQLTGAEAAVVVNNNAAALVLCLSELAQGKDVIISRSQLVEIGGGFRIPDIMRQSGANLVEVGATNRAYVSDYDSAVSNETGLILRVHHSNFKLVGFTAEPSLAELVSLGKQHNLPVMDDLGSGTLLDTTPYGLAHEPTIQESIQAGVSVVTASGDKLLGGPQAGLVFGQADVIARLKKHPLIRAFRVDKTTLAALQATLLAYLQGTAIDEIPVWRMISASKNTLSRRAGRWRRALAKDGISADVVNAFSAVGGGSLPGQQMPTRVLAIPAESPSAIAAKLRTCQPPVIARVEDNRLIFDPRTVLPEQDRDLTAAIKSALKA